MICCHGNPHRRAVRPDAYSKTDNDRDEALYWIGSAAIAGSINAANLIAHIYDDGMHGSKTDACVALD